MVYMFFLYIIYLRADVFIRGGENDIAHWNVSGRMSISIYIYILHTFNIYLSPMSL